MNCRRPNYIVSVDRRIHSFGKSIHYCHVRAIMSRGVLLENILLHAEGLTIDAAAEETRNLSKLFRPDRMVSPIL